MAGAQESQNETNDSGVSTVVKITLLLFVLSSGWIIFFLGILPPVARTIRHSF